VDPKWFGRLVHDHAPHSSTALYAAAAICSLFFVALVWLRCLHQKSLDQLDEKWIFQTVAAASPIPTYVLLLVIPFDPDLAKSVLDDRIVVALAGLYGLVETLKDIRTTASNAVRRGKGELPRKVKSS